MLNKKLTKGLSMIADSVTFLGSKVDIRNSAKTKTITPSKKYAANLLPLVTVCCFIVLISVSLDSCIYLFLQLIFYFDMIFNY